LKSIRRSLLISLLGGVALSAMISGTVLHRQSRAVLTAQFDAALKAKALLVAALLEIEQGRLEFDFQPARMPEYMGGEEPEYFQLFLEDGQVLYRSATLGSSDLPHRFGPVEQPEFFDLLLEGGREGRAAGLRVTVVGEAADPSGGSEDGEDDEPEQQARAARIDVVLVAARARTELSAALASLRRTAWLSGSLLALLVLSVVLLSVRRGLLPVNTLGGQVARIGVDSLSRRIPADALPLELRSMVEKLNELLDRLEQAFLRERRMTANFAHELRNPIAELQSATEVALAWPDDEELGQRAICTAQAVSVRMGELIAGLLRLSRVASGQAQLEREEVDLCSLVERLWAGLEHQARERELCLEHRTPAGVTLKTDRALFTSVVSNLLENAVQHATRGTSIVCGGRRTGPAGFEWTLANTASELRQSDLPHLTEPFWQKDGSRSDSSHSGLGLTLVASITEALDMQLAFRLDGQFQVLLSHRDSGNGRA